MTAETDLLPLPPEDDDLPRSGMWNGSARTGSDPCWLRESVEAYARACVSSATEALRADVERLTGCLATANANHETFERRWYLAHDHAERLAEALREAADMLLADYPETAKRLRAALHPAAAQEAGND